MLYGRNLAEDIREGNPVHEVLEHVPVDDLLVLPYPRVNRSGFLIPHTPRLLLRRFKGSVLIIC